MSADIFGVTLNTSTYGEMPSWPAATPFHKVWFIFYMVILYWCQVLQLLIIHLQD
jgi:hypothetical protein